MFKKPLLIWLSVLLTSAVAVKAQDPINPADVASDPNKTGDSAGPGRFWQATLNGGHYMVALDRITSVSRHKYLLDGSLIIDEVTVDTLGQALARFYFITPISDAVPGNTLSGLATRGKEFIDKAAQSAGTEAQNMVVKKYPDTSHAKSIEYRIPSEAELSALYASVCSAWETGRGRKFSGK